MIGIMNNKHNKHAFLQKPKGGKYHYNEWTLLGAPCSVIKELVLSLSEELNSKGLKCGYLDMAHESGERDDALENIFVDHLSHYQLVSTGKIPDYCHRNLFNNLDILFVNGNHYKADNQIIILNEKKRDSLQRKTDKLDNVRLVLRHNADEFDFLKALIPESSGRFEWHESQAIAEYIYHEHHKLSPELFGLVLAGGKSTRMGEDKSNIYYHGKRQSEFEADMLSQLCSRTFISSNSADEDLHYPIIKDSFLDLGPFGGIVSAFRFEPNAAWLTIACDLPLLDQSTLEQLVKARDMSKLATCFYNPDTQFPEPLITIWEPRAYPVLLYFLSLGYSCPRKVLINSNIKMIDLDDVTKIRNSNTPQDRQEVMQLINNSGKE